MAEIKYEYTYDVVVLGAGTAGAAAAIAAADFGAKVLVVEQFGSAGGSGSLGLVTPLMSTGIKDRPQCSYIGNEIIERLYQLDASDGNKRAYFDPMMLSIVLEEMLHERGVTMLYHTMVTGVELEGGHITGIRVCNISGNGIVHATKRYIDATGDAVVCDFAGLPTLHGDEETHKNQPCSLRYMIGGVDVDAFWHYLAEMRSQAGLSSTSGDQTAPRPENFSDAVTSGERKRALKPVFLKAVEAGDLEEEDAIYWQFFTVPGRRDVLAFNCPEFFDIDDITNAEKQSFVQVQGKLRILRHLRFYRKYLPGFEHAYIAQISAMVGIREGRRAITEYIFTTEDAFAWRKFDDAVSQSNYPVDVHGRSLRNHALSRDENEPRKYYEIPFRSLIVKGVDNLLVAGRNLGAEFVAQSSVRIIPTCRSLGEAAGIAAALSTNDGWIVRAEMEKKGAEFAK
ncbi:MAG: FAD-dependent oxidoreductase [Firmicutes bacterium]|nr:FAD-dependent oxidoreductase [Bacillota bacterium]